MSEIILPSSGRPTSVFISSISNESLIMQRQGTTQNPLTGAWPTANLALFIPFTLSAQATITRFYWCNGTTASTDYLQVGVYDAAGNSVALGTNSGSPNYGTLASGVSQPQFDNVADFILYPSKVYFMALRCNGTTTHLLRGVPGARFQRGMGMRQQASLTTGLPTTATYAAASTASYIPLFGLTVRASP